MKQISISILFVMLLAVGASANSYCACCVERGFYSLMRTKPSAYDIGLFDEMKFNKKADLYMTEAGYDGVKGLPDLQKEIEGDLDVTFEVAGTFLKKAWTMSLATNTGKKGTMLLPMPRLMTQYKVDTREEEHGDRGLGVSLYKEWKLAGTVGNATGIFRSAAARTSYMLIFQGRGNGCDSSSDFGHWRLEITGPKADFTFLGGLDTQ
jgi:hypothetical protein